MSEPIHIISLGAGVQSSTMALMAAKGEITPMPTAAIFADTQAEPKSVYSWLDWLEKQLPFPVHRVTKGSLIDASLIVRTSKTGNRYTKHAIPAFITDGQSTGIAMRQCTTDFKIEIIYRKLRELRAGRKVIQWIGISSDEIYRMKLSRKAYATNRWPLVELSVSRLKCLAWMKSNGYPEPPRSSCSFCPYHSDREWNRLKTQEPEAFAQAVDYEKRFQETMTHVKNFRGVPWLHRSLKPLSEIDFSPKKSDQSEMFLDQFNNECEGMCGV